MLDRNRWHSIKIQTLPLFSWSHTLYHPMFWNIPRKTNTIVSMLFSSSWSHYRINVPIFLHSFFPRFLPFFIVIFSFRFRSLCFTNCKLCNTICISTRIICSLTRLIVRFADSTHLEVLLCLLTAYNALWL